VCWLDLFTYVCVLYMSGSSLIPSVASCLPYLPWLIDRMAKFCDEEKKCLFLIKWHDWLGTSVGYGVRLQIWTLYTCVYNVHCSAMHCLIGKVLQFLLLQCSFSCPASDVIINRAVFALAYVKWYRNCHCNFQCHCKPSISFQIKPFTFHCHCKSHCY
jgi:hypothetical protein